jgi:hypothetical protein
MQVRLLTLCAAALAVTTLLAAPQDRPATADQPNTNVQPGKAGTPGTVPLDGEWTVVSVARDGAAVDGADKLTVTIKDNIVRFNGPAADDKSGAASKMRPMRLDFGPSGIIRVAEANADGKFGGAGTAPPAGEPNPQPPTAAPPGPGAAGKLSGVYVLTPEYLAVAVFPAGTGTRPGEGGTRPGATAPDRKPEPTPPPAGDNPGAGTQPQPGAQPGGAQLRTHMSVILKRNGAAKRP